MIMSLARHEHILEDALEAAREERMLHKALRPRPTDRVSCRSCGQWFSFDDLTEDGLCVVCDEAVKKLERGII